MSDNRLTTFIQDIKDTTTVLQQLRICIDELKKCIAETDKIEPYINLIEDLSSAITRIDDTINSIINLENFNKNLYMYKITFRINRGSSMIPLYQTLEFYITSVMKPSDIERYSNYDIIFTLLHRGLIGYNVTTNTTIPSLVCIIGVNNQYITINFLDNNAAISILEDYIDQISVSLVQNQIIGG